MNLFVTSKNPEACAQALDDKRVGKMLMECNQMLSLAVKLGDPSNVNARPVTEDDIGTGKVCDGMAHKNHPVSIWVRASFGNFLWTAKHARALAGEFELRFGKTHGSAARTDYIMYNFQNNITGGDLTEFQNSARNGGKGVDFTHLPVRQAYRAYLNNRWATDVRKPVWTNRQPPSWYKETELDN